MGPVDQLNIGKAISKATDPKLKTDNWKFILDVCDLIREDPEDATPMVMQSLESKLKQENGNVTLRTLTLIVSIAENCGSRLQQEISSKHFTTLLFSMIENQNIHLSIKKSIAQIVKQLESTFKNDPSLRGIHDLRKKIKKLYPHLFDNDDKKKPNLPKKNIDDKENEDLQRALDLSLAEYEKQKKKQLPEYQQEQYNNNSVITNQQQNVPTTTTQVRRVKAMYDLSASEPGELSFNKGDIIKVLEEVYKDWWRGSCHGEVGIFPLNYVTPIVELNPQEIETENRKEAEVFNQKDNVDQLFNTLRSSSLSPQSSRDILQNSEVNSLYGSVTPLRPQVTKMLGKYSNQKNELNTLRQVLANAEASYNQLLDKAATSYTGQMNIPQPIQMNPTSQQNFPVQQPMYQQSNGHNYYQGTYQNQGSQPQQFSQQQTFQAQQGYQPPANYQSSVPQ